MSDRYNLTISSMYLQESYILFSVLKCQLLKTDIELFQLEVSYITVRTSTINSRQKQQHQLPNKTWIFAYNFLKLNINLTKKYKTSFLTTFMTFLFISIKIFYGFIGL